MINPAQVYQSNIAHSEDRIVKLKRELIFISIIRFFFFLFTLVTPFLLYEWNVFLAFLFMVPSLSIFFYFVKRYIRVSDLKKREQIRVEINKKELAALKHEFSQFDSGEEFIDPNHINSYDLDLFGKGSLFQYLNRTVTFKGKQYLGKRLQEPILNISKIQDEQELVKELDEKLNWRQSFAVEGLFYEDSEEESVMFEAWSKQHFGLKTQKVALLFMTLFPVFSWGALFFWIFTGNAALISIMLVAQLTLWMVEGKNITSIYSQFGKRVKALRKYGSMLEMIENESWKSKNAMGVVENLQQTGLPSKEILKLSRIIANYDNRNNLLMVIPLNLLLSWDYFFTYRLINWHEKNKANYPNWMNQLAYFDGVSSLSNYAYNHSNYTFPEFVDGDFTMESKEMGHPLINPSKMIPNDFDFKGSQQTIIVTGANMSGKSTFLRTVGVNMVLGMSGAPVCAEYMKFKPVEVFSNMRTTDSLFDDESYFFAELKRIKAILDEIDKGRDLLIILDEILKGTNSVDKLNGSLKLVKRLVAQRTTSIIATHDLKLTDIEEEYPKEVKNKCFEITIENDEMQFDYKLRDGVTTVMNATFLMKKMGIID